MTSWSEGDVDANGTRIHYHRAGAGDRPPIVLLHGITDNGLCWSRVAHRLDDRYDVLMPHARGHGLSEDIETGFSVDLLASDVADLVRALALDSPYLYGHSMGALTAIAVAATYPDLARAIVLEDPPLLDELALDSSSDERAKRTADAREGLIELNQLSPGELIARARRDNPRWAEEELLPRADSKKQVAIGVADHRGELVDYPWRLALARIDCPILLTASDPSRGALVTPEVAHEASLTAKRLRVAHIDGAGHSIHCDRFDESTAAVEALLADALQASTAR